MQALFRNKATRGRAPVATTRLDKILASLTSTHEQQGSQFSTTNVARGAMSLESIDDGLYGEIDSTLQGLSVAVEAAIDAADLQGMYTTAQKQAAQVIGVVAADPKAFLSNIPVASMESTDDFSFIPANGLSNVVGDRKIEGVPSMEAYDERDNKNAVVYSVAYNLQAARQDEFGEALFPTVVVTPDQVGYTVSIRLVMVYNEVTRNISGALDNFNRKNIIQAVIDPSILRNDQTKIVPVVRSQSVAQGVFVPAASIAPINIVTSDGETITTAPLAMGKKFSLLGVSQTDAMLAQGNEDSTDAIDKSVVLQNLYLAVPNSTQGATGPTVLAFPTSQLPGATFNYSVQDNYQLMVVNFNTDVLMINPAKTDVTGASISGNPGLDAIVTGNVTVRLSVSVSGSVNLQTADTMLYSSQITVASVTDQSGNVLSLTSGEGQTVANAFANASLIGYDLEAFRANLNRRQRGQLLDTTFYNQCFAVPLLSPITVPRPLTTGDATDSSDLAALITATHVRTSNAAVDQLLSVAGTLSNYVNSADYSPSANGAPAILGVARFLVQPVYKSINLDVASNIDSLNSTDRPADIQALLVNAIRDVVYNMYRDSGYKAAADAMAGGVSETPTVIIATDIVIARYLMVTGDFRTLGGEFDVKVVSTLNQEMKGKIAVTFGQFGEASEGVANPMHFGNMAWKPEMTTVLPLHRNGANSKELTVQPSFRHIVNLPVLAMFTVTGISTIAAGKVPVEFFTVNALPT